MLHVNVRRNPIYALQSAWELKMKSMTINTVARATLVLVAGSVLALSANAVGRRTTAPPPVVVPAPVPVAITPVVAPSVNAPVVLNPVVSCNAGGTSTVSRC
jgi:hypothetical protein